MGFAEGVKGTGKPRLRRGLPMAPGEAKVRKVLILCAPLNGAPWAGWRAGGFLSGVTRVIVLILSIFVIRRSQGDHKAKAASRACAGRGQAGNKVTKEQGDKGGGAEVGEDTARSWRMVRVEFSVFSGQLSVGGDWGVECRKRSSERRMAEARANPRHRRSVPMAPDSSAPASRR